MVTEQGASHPPSVGASAGSSAWLPAISSRLPAPAVSFHREPQLWATTANIEIMWWTWPPSGALCSQKVARGRHEMFIILERLLPTSSKRSICAFQKGSSLSFFIGEKGVIFLPIRCSVGKKLLIRDPFQRGVTFF